MILPYVEQANYYNTVTPRIQAMEFPGGWPESTSIFEMFMCPSESIVKKITNQGFHGNYLVCTGSAGHGPNSGTGVNMVTNGLFYPLSSTTIDMIKDGSSNTIMVGEIRLQRDGTAASGTGNIVTGSPHDLRGRYHNGYHGNTVFTTLRPPNTTVGDVLNYCAGTPDVPCRAASSATQQVELHARSWHDGGAQFCMGDGAVRFISNNIDTAIFQGLGTINGRETIGEF